tara:strand:- start:2174 stop:2569 length:396 start_codon:yes stop_codon:yes gene_type:complete
MAAKDFRVSALEPSSCSKGTDDAPHSLDLAVDEPKDLARNVILKFTGTGRTIAIREIRYLNNTVEQDNRFIKRVTRPMMGFKAFHSAAATIAGIETAHMIPRASNRDYLLRKYGLTAEDIVAAFDRASAQT